MSARRPAASGRVYALPLPPSPCGIMVTRRADAPRSRGDPRQVKSDRYTSASLNHRCSACSESPLCSCSHSLVDKQILGMTHVWTPSACTQHRYMHLASSTLMYGSNNEQRRAVLKGPVQSLLQERCRFRRSGLFRPLGSALAEVAN